MQKHFKDGHFLSETVTPKVWTVVWNQDSSYFLFAGKNWIWELKLLLEDQVQYVNNQKIKMDEWKHNRNT